MANSQAVATSFKVDLMNGIHAFGTTVARGGTGADTFKAALYTTTASIGASTASYTASGEVSGTNYVAGGTTFAWAAPNSSGTTAFSTPSANITWSTVTLATAFDCVLLYNSSQSNKAVASYTFGAQTITAGNFTITMPANAVGTAALQIS